MYFEVYPQEGHTVRRPDTQAVIPESGDIVPREPESFWRRREADGAVVLVPLEKFPETLDDYPASMRDARAGVVAEPTAESGSELETEEG